MRTTLTLDHDVPMKLRELAHRRKVSFREAQQVLRALIEGQRLMIDGQRMLSDDLRALVARIGALIQGRGDGHPDA